MSTLSTLSIDELIDLQGHYINEGDYEECNTIELEINKRSGL